MPCRQSNANLTPALPSLTPICRRQIINRVHKVSCILRTDKLELMLPTLMHRRIIPRREDMALQHAEADDAAAFEAHPVVGEDVVCDEGGPYRGATGGVSVGGL
jgi:hypothetical protein